ncbi:mycofactocin-coupled SDR family oxidoreductase [Rhodococcus rhodochrous]|uniref:3-ketoacyl-ACP reductase n=1 Tax=Rhodococcus rhodochrous KG-21 TaxID=1441923 RepID=A0A0M8PHJ8_RHORH|nr:mycofactocin-coupled SDR family oxidoreductase [Rhodococcus rhodochrous]KOS56694.1 3-ketoacyl-ACP reductase [Rhodococcus rhodochrous KG-21]
MKRVAGKVAFITGAGQGQGRAHAVRLAEEGADIIATDICTESIHPGISYKQATEEELEETKRLVEKTGQRCLTVKADVRSLSELKAAVAAGVAEFGAIDVVVANAGLITFHTSSLDISEELYDLIVDVNQKGVWNTIQATAPGMIDAKNGGSIILTSSCAGIRGQIPYAHYAAAKHAVVGLMKSFANELGRYGIRVNTIHPTGVSSPGMGSDPVAAKIWPVEPLFALGAMNVLPDLDQPITGEVNPVPTIAPEEISHTVLFLASDESRYMTGMQLAVDAGNTNKP